MVKVAATTGLALTTIAALTAIVFLVVPLGALALALRPRTSPGRRIENQDLTPDAQPRGGRAGPAGAIAAGSPRKRTTTLTSSGTP